jgi:hypothetical protein
MKESMKNKPTKELSVSMAGAAILLSTDSKKLNQEALYKLLKENAVLDKNNKPIGIYKSGDLFWVYTDKKVIKDCERTTTIKTTAVYVYPGGLDLIKRILSGKPLEVEKNVENY